MIHRIRLDIGCSLLSVIVLERALKPRMDVTVTCTCFQLCFLANYNVFFLSIDFNLSNSELFMTVLLQKRLRLGQ